MTFEVSRPNNTWKRIKTQHVALAAAAALAFSTLVGGVALHENGGGATGHPTTAGSEATSITRPSSTHPATTIFIVATEAQANELRATLAAAATEDPSGGIRTVFVAGSPESGQHLATMQGEVTQHGSGAQVIDLR